MRIAEQCRKKMDIFYMDLVRQILALDDDKYFLQFDLDQANLNIEECKKEIESLHDGQRIHLKEIEELRLEDKILREKIANKKTVIDSLHCEIKQHKQRLFDCRNSYINEIERIAQEKEYAISLLNSQLEESRKIVEETKIDLREKVDQLRRSDLHTATQQFIIMGLEKKVTELSKTVSDQNTTITRLKYRADVPHHFDSDSKVQEVERMNNIIILHERKIGELKQELEKRRSVLEERKRTESEVIDLKHNLREKENENHLLKGKLELMTKKMNKPERSSLDEIIEKENVMNTLQKDFRLVGKNPRLSIDVYLHQLELEIKDLKADNQELQKRLSAKENELQTERENVKKKGEQIRADANQNQQLKYELHNTKTQLESIKTNRDLEQILRQEAEKSEAHSQKQCDMESKAVDFKAMLQIQELERDLQIRDREIVSLQKKMATYDAETKNHLDEIENLKGSNRNWQRDVDDRKQEIQSITRERDHERHSRQVLEITVKEKETKLAESNNQASCKDKTIKSQEQKLKHLEHKLEQTNEELNKLKQDRDRKTGDMHRQRSIEDLQNNDKIKQLEKQLKEALAVLKSTESELEETKKSHDAKAKKHIEEKDNLTRNNRNFQRVVEEKKLEIQSIKKEMDHERHSRQVLENTVKEKEKQLADIKDRAFRKDSTLKSQEQTIKDLEHKLEQTNEELKNLKQYLDKMTDDTNRQRSIQSSQNNDKIKQLERQLKETLGVLKSTETELEETKTRLSKTMGDRLTDNNPNITDLSDTNRPVKLAERYSELYDNQWTDALEVLGNKFDDEQSNIQLLLEILQDTMQFCTTYAARQIDDLHQILGLSKGADVPVSLSKNLKDLRKSAPSHVMKTIYQMYVSQLQRSSKHGLKMALEVKPFVKECIELSWLMTIQDPPVVIAPVAVQGSRFNTDIYRHYTSSGSTVAFTVWPALLLHEGGPVLAKGVAQGSKGK